MARKIRFPLKMTNGMEVRTIDELRTNFDLTAVLGYYADDKLVTWLKHRFYENEAKEIEALDKNSKNFQFDLCKALGVEMSFDSDEADGTFAEEFIKRRNEKRRILRDITDDEKILISVDSAAFNQDDLYEIYDNGEKEIYLCQGEFEIPLNITDVTYIGVDNPAIKLRSGNMTYYDKNNIKFINCGLDTEVSSKKNNERSTDEFDNSEDLESLENRAKQGNAKAQFCLAERYYNGDGVEQDYLTACMWYTRAAEKGDPDAQNMLGICYRYGKGVVQNCDTAVKWFLKSAEQGSFRAKNNLGNCYYNGHGVQQDHIKAVRYYKESADAGYALAQYNLGKYYLTSICGVTQRMNGRINRLFGISTTDDNSSANRDCDAEMWFTKAADQGNVPAMMELAELYLGRSLGEPNVLKAIDYLTKASEQGKTEAMVKLAEIYMDGEFVNRNEVKAVEFLTKAAEKNNSYAQFKLGEIYSGGFGKIAKDKNSSEEWYRKSAKQGNEKAKSKPKKLKEKIS